MEQKEMSRWLKAVIIFVGLAGLAVYICAIPMLGKEIIRHYPEFSGWFWPWMIFLWITGVPCYITLAFGWKIAVNIGKDQSFTFANADYLKKVSYLSAGDSIFFFAGNIVLWLLNMNHPGVVLCSLLVVFAGIAVVITTAALSHLVQKAAVLQEQSDLTI